MDAGLEHHPIYDTVMAQDRYEVMQDQQQEINRLSADNSRLRADLAAALAAAQWTPVEDGFGREEVTFGGRHTERISVTEDWLNVAWRPETGEFERASFQLPDDLRLCRRGNPLGVAAQVWQPVVDLEYDCQCDDCRAPDAWRWQLYVNGDSIGIVDPANGDDDRYVVLPPHLALCELVRRVTAGEGDV